MSSADLYTRRGAWRADARQKLRVALEELSAGLQEYGPVAGVMLGLGALLYQADQPSYRDHPGRIATVVETPGMPACAGAAECAGNSVADREETMRKMRRDAVRNILGGPAG